MGRWRTLLILGCVFLTMGMNYTTQRVAKDNYYFERKEYEFLTFEVEVVILKDKDEFRKVAREFFPSASVRNNVEAWSKLTRMTDDDGNVTSVEKCTIYIPDPMWKYEPEHIGHEMAHCMWGKWHPIQNKNNTNISPSSIYYRSVRKD